MAQDELILKLKVDADGANKKIDSTDKQLKTLNKSSTETSKGFGIADTKAGKMFAGIKSGAQKGAMGMKSLRSAVISTGIGALVIAVIALIQYFTKSAKGAEQLKVIMAALGQVITVVTDTFIKIGEALVKIAKIVGSVVKGNKTLKEGWSEAKDVGKDAIDGIADSYKNLNNSVKEAISLAQRENQLRTDRRKNLVEEAKLNVEIANLKERIDDAQLTETDRIEKLNTLQEKQNALYDERVRVAREDYEIKKAQNALGESTLDDMDEEAQLLATLINQEADRANAQKEITAKRSALILAEQAKRKAAHDAYVAQTAAEKKIADKALADEEKRLAKEEELRVAAQQKREDDLKAHQDALAILRLEGQDMELEQLNQWYEKQFEALAENEEARLVLMEEFKLKEDAINNKYLEKAAKDQEATSIKNAATVKAEEDAKKAVRWEGVNALASIGQSLQALAGENQKLAIAGLLIEKGAAIGSIAAQTGIGVSKAVAASPLTGGLPWSALILGAGILNVATVVAQAAAGVQEIKAAKMATGGFFSGPSHAQGGIPFNGAEVEGGEYLVNKKTMSNPMMRSEIMNMNSAGNLGIDYTGGSGGLSREEAVALIKETQSIPVIVTQNQITEAQKSVTVREERFTIS